MSTETINRCVDIFTPVLGIELGRKNHQHADTHDSSTSRRVLVWKWSSLVSASQLQYEINAWYLVLLYVCVVFTLNRSFFLPNDTSSTLSVLPKFFILEMQIMWSQTCTPE